MSALTDFLQFLLPNCRIDSQPLTKNIRWAGFFKKVGGPELGCVNRFFAPSMPGQQNNGNIQIEGVISRKRTIPPRPGIFRSSKTRLTVSFSSKEIACSGSAIVKSRSGLGDKTRFRERNKLGGVINGQNCELIALRAGFVPCCISLFHGDKPGSVELA